MAEVWLRVLRRAGGDPRLPLMRLQNQCWKSLHEVVRCTLATATGINRDALALDLPAGPTPTVTPRGLLEELREIPSRRLRHLMVVVFLPSENDSLWPQWARELLRLAVLFPEVCFRFVTDDATLAPPRAGARLFFRRVQNSDGASSCPFENLADTKMELGADLEDFCAGYREWFDPLGVRQAYRINELWNKELSDRNEPIPALIVEDEREYAELLAYTAYRTGAYGPEIIANGACYERRFKQRVKTLHDDFLVIHSFDLPFAPFNKPSGKDDGSGRVSTLRNAWLSAVENGNGDWTKGCRMIVTGGRHEGFTVVEPHDWGKKGKKDQCEDRFGWKGEDKEKENDNDHEIRGLAKPLPWIHGLIERGMFPRALRGKDQDWVIEGAFCDGIAAEKGKGGHSAPDRAQEIAGFLLERARACVGEYLPTMAAVLAIDALRTLRGHSATLYMDALSVLYRAEVAVELEVGSAAGGDPRRATQLRSSEVRKLLTYLQGEPRYLLPEGMETGSPERLWTMLRQKFLDTGAFEAADEALMEIHRSRGKRWRAKWVRRFGSDLLCVWGGLRMAFKRASRNTILGLAYFAAPLAVLALVYLTVLANERTLRRLHDPSYAWLVPLAAALGLFWAFFLWPDGAGWVGPAIRPGRWLATALLATLILTTANIALLADEASAVQPTGRSIAAVPKEKRSIYGRYRLRCFVSAYLWTCGNAVGSETLPQTLDIAGKTARIQFRGSGGGGEHESLAKSALWMENVLTGWVLFAFGLSAVYRRAVRG